METHRILFVETHLICGILWRYITSYRGLVEMHNILFAQPVIWVPPFRRQRSEETADGPARSRAAAPDGGIAAVAHPRRGFSTRPSAARRLD